MKKKLKIALIGSPNVGKSVIFGALTKKYVTVSNYPGTTVEVSRGNAKLGDVDYEIIDTPGLYSVFPITEEERVTIQIIKNEKPDLIIHVIDTKHLERMLPLTFQLQEANIPMIVVLNMFDEALKLEININTALLSELLSMPVVATVAITQQGIGQLISKINDKKLSLTEENKSQWEASSFSNQKMKAWYKKSVKIFSRVVKRIKKPRKLSRFDKMLISPITGIPILALVIYLGLYKFVGEFGAGTVVDFFEKAFETYLNPWLVHLATTHIPWASIQMLLIGDYGIVTLGIKYAAVIILPIVGLFFLVFALIEDSGYLPRLAFMLDRAFKKIGLSGRAIIPMVLGLGCDTMATMVTRTLPTKRERFIATLLLALCIPCSAQIGVILGLLSNTPKVLAAWFFIIFAIFLSVGFAMAKLIPGTRPSFVIEVPPMRMPQLKNVLIKTYMRMKWYFKEIVPLFILASIIIWLLQITGIFDLITKAMKFPLDVMGLPVESARVFIFGFFRRDYGAAGLYDLYNSGIFTNNQILIAVVVLTLFLPCITQLLIMIKERGIKIGLGISIFVLFFACTVGTVLNWIITSFGISF